jgi:UrcA family protein
MYPNVRRILTALVAFLALLGAARTALATGYEEPVARQLVSWSDLNLDDRADAAKLYKRLQSAAARVCHDDLGAYVQSAYALRKCTSVSLAGAVERVSHPNVTAIHAAYAGSGALVSARR